MASPFERLSAALADRYRLERELGAGGMATVYLAHDLKHDRKVAVKVLRPELAAVLGTGRFLREIETTARLTHPAILPLLDSGDADGILWYTMPYFTGRTLKDRLVDHGAMPQAEALGIFRDVAGALDQAHRHGVLHRDLKPANILLQDGRAVLADFGIALPTGSSEARLTESGLSIGTPEYMSPEQALGERNLDARSDVYALGCVLYQMLAGEPPFRGTTPQAVIAKRLMEPVPRIGTGRRDGAPSGSRRDRCPIGERGMLGLQNTTRSPACTDRPSCASTFCRCSSPPGSTWPSSKRSFTPRISSRCRSSSCRC